MKHRREDVKRRSDADDVTNTYEEAYVIQTIEVERAFEDPVLQDVKPKDQRTHALQLHIQVRSPDGCFLARTNTQEVHWLCVASALGKWGLTKSYFLPHTTLTNDDTNYQSTKDIYYLVEGRVEPFDEAEVSTQVLLRRRDVRTERLQDQEPSEGFTEEEGNF